MTEPTQDEQIRTHLRDAAQGARCGPYPEGFDTWSPEEHASYVAEAIIRITDQVRGLLPADHDSETIAGPYGDNFDFLAHGISRIAEERDRLRLDTASDETAAALQWLTEHEARVQFFDDGSVSIESGEERAGGDSFVAAVRVIRGRMDS